MEPEFDFLVGHNAAAGANCEVRIHMARQEGIGGGKWEETGRRGHRVRDRMQFRAVLAQGRWWAAAGVFGHKSIQPIKILSSCQRDSLLESGRRCDMIE